MHVLVVTIEEVHATYELGRDPIAGILHLVGYATAAAVTGSCIEE